MSQIFKTLTDLRDIIKDFEGFIARPTPKLHHPTLYRKSGVGKDDILIKGVRKKDFLFSTDEKWILPHDQMGLSFSVHWQHLKAALKMKQSRNLGKAIDVYFTLEKSDIPYGLAFVPDNKNPRHYLLVATEQMTVEQLVSKLKMLAHRMSVIRNGGKAL
jgi:hypothetical protein